MWPFDKRNTREQELDRELRAHLELEAEEQRASGLSEEEAHYAAKRALGNQSLTKENVRAVWNWTFLETLGQDLRYAFRSLRGSPAFALVAIASLGLGIGANTAIFSFVNALILKHLPVPEPTRLVTLSEYENGRVINDVFSFPMIQELEKGNKVFAGITGRYPVPLNLMADTVGEPLNGEVVTAEYFKTLQVKPAIGRLLNAEDINAGAGNPVCVISYALWQTRFGGDPHILGRKLNLNAHPYSVVGVTERGFFGPRLHNRIDIQLPVSRAGDFMNGPFVSMWKSAGFSWLEPLARLKPGVSAKQAQAMIEPLAQTLRVELANPNQRGQVRKTNFRLSDGSQGVNVDDTYFKPVSILMGVVGLVLLIACANVANLLLARASARATEFAVRVSLGASRLRLMRQLMVESLVLAFAGGALGLALAFWMIRSLLLYLNAGSSGGDGIQVSLDLKLIGFSILSSLLTAIVFGLVPAWQSVKPTIMPELRRSQGHLSGGAAMRKILVVGEIALAMVILFAAGLLTRSLSKLKTIDLGFDPERVITLRIDPAMNGATSQQSERIFDDILSRLRALPGISAASLAVVTPLQGGMISLDFELPGHLAKSTDAQTNFNMISSDYFKTLKQTVLAGREFDERDSRTSRKVAIVNRLFVSQYMPGENPIGKQINVGGDNVEIVGLVKNSYYQRLREKMGPLIYLPVKQTQSSGFTLLVRTSRMPKQQLSDIEHAIRGADPKLPIYSVREMPDLIDQGITSERMLTFLAALFSGLVTLLCCIGVAGLIAYAVSRRTREIGIRFAIGAQKSDVAKLFFQESAVLLGAGVIVGVPLAIVSARVLRSLLYGVAATDTAVLASTVAIFLVAGLFASVLPVRRATRIEPTQALRHE